MLFPYPALSGALIPFTVTFRAGSSWTAYPGTVKVNLVGAGASGTNSRVNPITLMTMQGITYTPSGPLAYDGTSLDDITGALVSQITAANAGGSGVRSVSLIAPSLAVQFGYTASVPAVIDLPAWQSGTAHILTRVNSLSPITVVGTLSLQPVTYNPSDRLYDTPWSAMGAAYFQNLGYISRPPSPPASLIASTTSFYNINPMTDPVNGNATVGQYVSGATGASSTGIGHTFPGGSAGSPATPTSFANVATTPGRIYPLSIPTGGYITISGYRWL